jgi:AmpD protein
MRGCLRVSAHFVIRRSGQLLQFISCDRRAWHAGTSQWRDRGNCNDYSIGIELRAEQACLPADPLRICSGGIGGA